jgi:hypothetical protein
MMSCTGGLSPVETLLPLQVRVSKNFYTKKKVILCNSMIYWKKLCHFDVHILFISLAANA